MRTKGIAFSPVDWGAPKVNPNVGCPTSSPQSIALVGVRCAHRQPTTSPTSEALAISQNHCKPPKLLIGAMLRKLVHVAFGVLKLDRKFAAELHAG